MGDSFRLPNDEQRIRVAAAAFELLEQVGVRLTEPEARALLSGADARFERKRIHIPTHLVEDAIPSVPSGISIYTRSGELKMQLEGLSATYGAHTDAPDVLDPFTGERRPCSVADVRRNAVLIDALSNISLIPVACASHRSCVHLLPLIVSLVHIPTQGTATACTGSDIVNAIVIVGSASSPKTRRAMNSS